MCRVATPFYQLPAYHVYSFLRNLLYLIRAWCRQNGIRENSYYYWLRIIREEALRETENRSGALVRVEPEKLTVETVSPQPSSRGIVIRAHGVETEFPSGADIGILAAFVKAISHA